MTMEYALSILKWVGISVGGLLLLIVAAYMLSFVISHGVSDGRKSSQEEENNE